MKNAHVFIIIRLYARNILEFFFFFNTTRFAVKKKKNFRNRRIVCETIARRDHGRRRPSYVLQEEEEEEKNIISKDITCRKHAWVRAVVASFVRRNQFVFRYNTAAAIIIYCTAVICTGVLGF